MYDKIKRFYDLGLYDADKVAQFAKHGCITQEQYQEIVGGDSK